MSGEVHNATDDERSENRGRISQVQHKGSPSFKQPLINKCTSLRSPGQILVGDEEPTLLYPGPPRSHYMRQYPRGVTNCACLAVVSMVMGLICMTTAATVDTQTTSAGALPATSERSVADTVLTAMNRRADPCTDFYEYACGSWSKGTSIPAAESSLAKSFDGVSTRVKSLLRRILENPTSGPTIASKFYSACMAKMGLGSPNLKPLERYGDLVRGINTSRDLAVAVGKFHAGFDAPLFNMYVGIDSKNPERYAVFLGQGGLGMSHRDHYLSKRKEYVYLRANYTILMKTMLTAAAKAKMVPFHEVDDLVSRVMKFETALANATVPPQDSRDPEKSYNKRLLRELPKALYMKECLQAAGFNTNQLQNGVILRSPNYFSTLAGLVVQMEKSSTMRRTVRAYLALRATREMAGMGILGERLYRANFEFRRVRSGIKTMDKRWVQCQGITGGYFGNAVGAAFVKKHFSNKTRGHAVDMVSNIRRSFLQILKEAKWLDRKTRLLAQEKIEAIGLKVGYGDNLDTFDDVSFGKNDYEEGIFSAIKHHWKKQVNRLGNPVDKSVWYMHPYRVNAYYSQSLNEIVFPAGILQQPFFSDAYPAAMNYGAIGSVVGHEFSHSVDDRGRQYDKTGRLSAWWTKTAARAFKSRTKCFVDLYNKYKPRQTDLHLLGKLTLSENLADVGGVKGAFKAFQKQIGTNPAKSARPSNKLLAKVLTNNQLFFVAYAQNWCIKYRKESLETQIKSDPHSPGMFRVQGPLSQFEEFAKAFKCKSGTVYNPPKRCTLW